MWRQSLREGETVSVEAAWGRWIVKTHVLIALACCIHFPQCTLPLQMSIGSSLFEQDSREHTPVATPTATPLSTPMATPQLTEKKAKKKKPALFSKIRKSTGKRGSVGESGYTSMGVFIVWEWDLLLWCIG